MSPRIFYRSTPTAADDPCLQPFLSPPCFSEEVLQYSVLLLLLLLLLHTNTAAPSGQALGQVLYVRTGTGKAR